MSQLWVDIERLVLDVLEPRLKRVEELRVLRSSEMGDARPQVFGFDDVVRLAPHLLLERGRIVGVVCVPDRKWRPAAVADGVRIGAYELQLQKSDVLDFQRVVCLKPDGVFTVDTRLAILKYLNDHQLKDQKFPDRITDKDGTKLRDALDAGPRCS